MDARNGISPRRTCAGTLAALALLGVGSSSACATGPAAHQTRRAAAPCTRYAAPWGSNGARGSFAHPFRGVRRLIHSLRPGQKGCLRKGIYRENLSINRGGSARRPITLRSYPGETARLVGTLTLNDGASNLIFDHLYLDGVNSRGAASPIVTARNVTFRNNDVTNEHTAICFLLGVPGYGRAKNVAITRNRIHDCGRLPRTQLDHGIYVEHTNAVVISQNWIYDNADFGVHLYPDAQGTRVTGNVIDGNGMGITFSGEDHVASNDNLVEHNVISNSVERYNVENYFPGPTGHGNVLRSNCVGGGVRDSGNGGIQVPHAGFDATGNVIAAARFPARVSGNFQLSRGSPCGGVLPRAKMTPGVGTPAPPRAFVVVLHAPQLVRHGKRLRVRGVVAIDDGRRIRQAMLQVHRGSGWRTLATAFVKRDRWFRLGYRVGRRRGRLRLRVVARGAHRSRSFRVAVG
ncbi:MAG: right-handed parallel beta-helix repeat-containing protein [Thermoleophilaceae bacterium]